jgi:hypothetical protein
VRARWISLLLDQSNGPKHGSDEGGPASFWDIRSKVGQNVQMVALRSRRLETLFGVTLDDLAPAHIQSLVTNQVSEEFDLDFKRELYGNRDADRRALAGDMAALANTAGGVIILGVEENEQAVAVRADGVDLSDAEEQRMRQIIASLTAPIPTFDIIRVPEEGNPSRGYYAIAVPRSIRAPHAVIVNDGYRFPKRNGSTTRYLSEPEIAEAYRDRFFGADQQIRRIEQVEAEALERLDVEKQAWLTVTLVPELSGSIDITHAVYRQFERQTLGTPTNDIFGRYGSTFQQARVGRRRLIADGSRDAGLSTYASAEYHSDGAGAYSLRVADLAEMRQRLPGEDPPSNQVLNDESIVEAALTGVRRLAVHARDRAAAGGNAVIRVRLTPKSTGPTDIRIGYTRGGGVFGDSWGQSTTAGARRPVETEASIDEIAEAGPVLVSTTSRLVDELCQNFGFAELAQLTASGELRGRYWSNEVQSLVTDWAQANGIEIIDDLLG